MWRWRRGEQLKTVIRKIRESRWIRDGRPACTRRWRTAAVKVGQRRPLRAGVVGQHAGGRKSFHAVQLFERLGGGCGVVIADLRHPDHRDAFAAQRPELAWSDRVRHQVRGTCDAVDVGVQAAVPPSSAELQALLAQGELQRRDRVVELGGQPHPVHPEAGQGVMVRLQDRLEVIDDLHPSRIQRGRTGRPRDDGHVGAVAPCGERGAVTRDPATDDENFGQCRTMRRVSATSRFSC